MQYVAEKDNCFECLIDGSRFPFSAATKEIIALAAAARAYEIIVAQTRSGIRLDATLRERMQAERRNPTSLYTRVCEQFFVDPNLKSANGT